MFRIPLSCVASHLHDCWQICIDTASYYACLLHFMFGQGSIKSASRFHLSVYRRVHLYSLARTLQLWTKPHYRAATTQRDFYSNLVNVAVPGTGIALSFFALHRLTLLLFLFFVYPTICLVFAIYLAIFHRNPPPSPTSQTSAFYAHDAHGMSASRSTARQDTAGQNTAHQDTARSSTAHSNKSDGAAPYHSPAPLSAAHLSSAPRSETPLSTAHLSAADCDTAHTSVVSNNIAGGINASVSDPSHHSNVSITSFIRVKYAEFLLEPTSWFALWRLNCLLVAWHSYATASHSYGYEDKGRFLLKGAELGLPVTPFLQDRAVVLKHKNMEGGLGIHFFKNFVDGGDWIIQPYLENSEFLQGILPSNAPLSTLRVITASKLWLKQQQGQVQAATKSSLEGKQEPSQAGIQLDEEDVQVFAVVLRAGFSGAATDHNSICFNVDPVTGLIGQGISNQHWYKLGLQHALRPGPTFLERYQNHPNSSKPPIQGQVIPNMPEMLKLITASHRSIVPDVPLVGWDVALTDSGVFVLEINISCNFFDGKYDHDRYTQFMYDHFVALEALDKEKQQ